LHGPHELALSCDVPFGIGDVLSCLGEMSTLLGRGVVDDVPRHVLHPIDLIQLDDQGGRGVPNQRRRHGPARHQQANLVQGMAQRRRARQLVSHEVEDSPALGIVKMRGELVVVHALSSVPPGPLREGTSACLTWGN